MPGTFDSSDCPHNLRFAPMIVKAKNARIQQTTLAAIALRNAAPRPAL
jgi:hypothetical protein